MDELEKRFTYHAPTKRQQGKYKMLRDAALTYATIINHNCPESREKETAMTRLDEVVMHTNAAIARRENEND